MQRRISCLLTILGLALLSACGGGGSSTNSTTTTSAPPGIFYSHNAVFLNNTTVWAWGDNESGQLGNNSAANSSIPLRAIARFGGYSGNGTAVGSNHTLAFQKYSTIRAWGFNGYGQLGNGVNNVTLPNQTPNSWVPVAVRKKGSPASLSGIVAVAAGGYHSLALDRTGNVWSWGNNANGQLGRQPTPVFTIMSTQTADRVQSLPDPRVPFTSIVAISAGGNHSLALDNSGGVWAWGYNGYGQLGNGITINSNGVYPSPVTIPSTIVRIAAGGSHSLALDILGNVWAWGYNNFGQLGDGTRIDRNTPVPVTGLSGITLIAAGLDHSLAYNATTDTLYAWGYNQYGQLGVDTSLSMQIPDTKTPYEPSPKAIQGFQLRQVSGTLPESILAVGHHSHARKKTDGSWWSWGDNSLGQLGIGTTTNSSSPLPVKWF